MPMPNGNTRTPWDTSSGSPNSDPPCWTGHHWLTSSRAATTAPPTVANRRTFRRLPRPYSARTRPSPVPVPVPTKLSPALQLRNWSAA
jgi:hypothetical protein